MLDPNCTRDCPPLRPSTITAVGRTIASEWVSPCRALILVMVEEIAPTESPAAESKTQTVLYVIIGVLAAAENGRAHL